MLMGYDRDKKIKKKVFMELHFIEDKMVGWDCQCDWMRKRKSKSIKWMGKNEFAQ